MDFGKRVETLNCRTVVQRAVEKGRRGEPLDVRKVEHTHLVASEGPKSRRVRGMILVGVLAEKRQGREERGAISARPDY